MINASHADLAYTVLSWESYFREDAVKQYILKNHLPKSQVPKSLVELYTLMQAQAQVLENFSVPFPPNYIHRI